jgi:phage shock protein PspC (stress-responsive transcriptional regulator)
MMDAMNDAPPTPPRDRLGPGRGRLVREPDDRMIAGVCSGLADWLGLDVRLVRAAAFVLVFVTPWTIVAYLVAQFALPERQPDEPRAVAEPVGGLGDVHPAVLVAAVVVAVAVLDHDWWLRPFPAAVVLVALGIWLLTRDRTPRARISNAQGDRGTTIPADAPGPEAGTGLPVEPTPPGPGWSPGATGDPGPVDDAVEDPTLTGDDPELTAGYARTADDSTFVAEPWAPAPVPSRRRSFGAVAAAVILIGGGLVWLLDSLGALDVSWRDGLAAALVATGAGMLAATWRGRAAVLIPVAVVLVTLLVADEAFRVPLNAGVGDRTVVVETRDQLDEPHELLAGSLTVDLTDTRVPRPGTTEIEAAVGVGELRVRVPEDATVTVEASVRAGELDWPGRTDSYEAGTGIDRAFDLEGEPGGPRLHLDLSMGLGEVEVSRG